MKCRGPRFVGQKGAGTLTMPVTDPPSSSPVTSSPVTSSPVSRRLKKLWEYWCGKCRKSRLPARADIDPGDFPAHLPTITLFDVEVAPARYRFRLVGTGVSRLMPHDPTGRYLDEVLNDSELNVASEVLGHVAGTAAPTAIPGRLAWGNRCWLPAEWLFLPLSNDGLRVNIILGCLDVPAMPLRIPSARPRLIFEWAAGGGNVGVDSDARPS
jgi:hypothetical protein